MCEAMGTEPIEEEVPVALSDLPEDIQLVLVLYYKIPDRWEYMSGTYLGKDLSSYRAIAEIFGVDDLRHTLELILLIDSVRVEYQASRQKNKPKEKPDGSI